MIYEAATQYLCGFLNASLLNSSPSKNIFDDPEWDKELAFGDYNQKLKKMLKESNPEDLITSRINSMLKIKYEDKEGVELFKKVLKEYGWNTTIPDRIAIGELIEYMIFIRNKTRGHGTPSKIPIEFYICLDKLTLFLINGLKNLEFGIFINTYFEEENWLVNLSSGGCPKLFPIYVKSGDLSIYFPISQREKMTQEYESKQSLIKEFEKKSDLVLMEIQNGNEKLWYDLSTFFKSDKGILYAYNGRKKGKEPSYISYTTGDLIRPTII